MQISFCMQIVPAKLRQLSESGNWLVNLSASRKYIHENSWWFLFQVENILQQAFLFGEIISQGFFYANVGGCPKLNVFNGFEINSYDLGWSLELQLILSLVTKLKQNYFHHC